MKKDIMQDTKRNQRYYEILDTAKKLFAVKGYHSTSTRSINTSIGVADGLLYHYFPQGKQQILDVIIQHELIQQLDVLQQNLNKIKIDVSLDEFLSVMCNMGLDNLITRDQDAMIVLFREKQNLSIQCQRDIHASMEQLICFLTKRFQRYIDNGEMKPLNVKLVTMQLLGAYQHFILMKMLGTWDLIGIKEEQYAQMLVKHLLACWKN